jgi:class 3 adenylate cyclase
LRIGRKLLRMSESEARFSVLRQSADAGAVAAIERLVREAPDRALARVNVLEFAATNGLDEERAIAAFLHAAKLGLFDLSWNVLCPGCGGVLDSNATLKTLDKAHYSCALCAVGYEPNLDEMVEVAFTVNPRVRRIAAHDPNTLPQWEYARQVFWSSGIDLPEDEAFDKLLEEIVIEAVELPAGEKAILSLQLPAQFVIVFDTVTHAAHFIDVKGEPTRERQGLSLVFNKVRAPTGTVEMRPGPLRLSLENRTDVRVLPAVFIAAEAMHDLLGKRRKFLTAKRLLTNQTFRDIYRTDTLDVDQRLKITSLTFLFTDLKGSTELYERVGDLVAYDMVRAHFGVLNEAVAAEAGAVVKTIGDAVMATFPTPERALAAALRMRESMRTLNEQSGREDLLLKIGMHEGPCLAVTLNDRLDYFGQTVNIAARVQGLAVSHAIFATEPVVENPLAARLLGERGLTPVSRRHSLRGIANELTVYEIP